MATGEYLAIVAALDRPLGCPLPGEGSAEDDRLGAVVLERVLPLLQRLRRLRAEPASLLRLTFAVSSTLATVLRHEGVTARIERRLAALSADDPCRILWDEIDGDVVGALADLQESGHVELVACPASSAVLPLLAPDSRAIAAQVAVGCQEHTRLFGRRPRGLWLPGRAYAPFLDETLAREGLRFVVLAARAILQATPRPLFGLRAPIVTPAGVAAFGAADPSADGARPASGMDRPAIAVTVYEIGGPEHVEVVEHAVRRAAPDARVLTLGEYLERHPENQRATPAASSGEAGGFFDPWLVAGGGPLRHADHACRRMTELARRHPAAGGLLRRTLDQAARELLLLQSRDHVEPGAPPRGFAAHLSRFARLVAMAESGSLDEARVAVLERRSPVFPLLDYRIYA